MSWSPMDGVVCALGMQPSQDDPSPSNRAPVASNETLLALPDELISGCLVGLDAVDLVQVEMACRRTRDVVTSDAVRWHQAVNDRWAPAPSPAGVLSTPAENSQQLLLESAAHIAGGWKRLYAEKHMWERKKTPWVIPSDSETQAIIEIVKGDQPNKSFVAGSPTSVMLGDVDEPQLPAMTVVFLIDGSSSVTEEDFNTMKSFTGTFLTSLRVTHPGSTACLIQFNQYPRVEQDLVPIRTGIPQAALNKVEQMMGSTDIAAPIQRAREILRRDDCPPGDKVIIMLTDGQTHAEELRISEAQAQSAAEDVGARLFTFGVGRDVDETGLERIAASTRSVHENAKTIHQPAVQGVHGGCYFTLRRLRK